MAMKMDKTFRDLEKCNLAEKATALDDWPPDSENTEAPSSAHSCLDSGDEITSSDDRFVLRGNTVLHTPIAHHALTALSNHVFWHHDTKRIAVLGLTHSCA